MTISEHPFFLDGALNIAQGSGYRAGMDAVLLAASINMPKNKHALELGCGVATALLCAAWRNPQVQFYGLEKQTELLQIANENITRNHMQTQVEVVAGDIANLPAPFRQDQFDQVFFNPPFQETRDQ
ncbi:tRNA (adenine37-N(6))-methyltransferase TrmN6, partial [hydrothermal vent metagenome]